jgi:hypothetical protein
MDFQIDCTPYPIGCWIVSEPPTPENPVTIDEPPRVPNGNPFAFAGARFDSAELGQGIDAEAAVAITLGLAVRRAWSLPDNPRASGFFEQFLGGSTVTFGSPNRAIEIARFGRVFHPVEGSIETPGRRGIEFYALIAPEPDADTLGQLARDTRILFCSLISKLPEAP